MGCALRNPSRRPRRTAMARGEEVTGRKGSGRFARRSRGRNLITSSATEVRDAAVATGVGANEPRLRQDAGTGDIRRHSSGLPLIEARDRKAARCAPTRAWRGVAARLSGILDPLRAWLDQRLAPDLLPRYRPVAGATRI